MLNNQIRELIPIEVHNGHQAVNARHLYVWLGVRKDFSTWMKVQFKRCDLMENVDYQSFPLKGERETGGTTRIEYALSLNAAKEISMMSQTQKGKEARRYFIECEQIALQKSQSITLPQNYKQALLQLVAQIEMNEKLQLENNNLVPKARIYDQVMQSPETEWLKTTSSVANEIGMSAQKLNKMLVACGIIYKTHNGEYLFTNDYIGWNLGKLVSCVINEEKGQIATYIKWNTRGRAYIHALYDTNWDKRRAWHLLRNAKES